MGEEEVSIGQEAFGDGLGLIKIDAFVPIGEAQAKGFKQAKTQEHKSEQQEIAVVKPKKVLPELNEFNDLYLFLHFRLSHGLQAYYHASMFQKTFPLGPLGANCTILADEESRDAFVVDPGAEAERVFEELEAQNLTLKKILLTHAHVDHLGAAFTLSEKTEAPVYLHEDDNFLVEKLSEQASFVGDDAPGGTHKVDHFLKADEILKLGQKDIRVAHTPGHSPGSVSFIIPDESLVIVGDVLFAGSIGRTDLWGGDFDTLERSIKEKLYTLDDETRVITGHGPPTQIGIERRHNPFVRG